MASADVSDVFPANNEPLVPFRGAIPRGTRRLPFRIAKVDDRSELLERIGLVSSEAEILQEISEASDRKLRAVGLTRNTVVSTLGHHHLEDEVITRYFKMIQRRNFLCPSLPRCLALPAAFADGLTSGIRFFKKRSIRMMKKHNLLDGQIVLIPIQKDQVWHLLSVTKQDNTWHATMYDVTTEGAPMEEVHQILAEVGDLYKTSDELQIYKATPYTPIGEVLVTKEDSGVFVCRMADIIARERQINFDSEDLQVYRCKILLELFKNKILSFVSNGPCRQRKNGSMSMPFTGYGNERTPFDNLTGDPDFEQLTSEEEGYGTDEETDED